MPKPDDANSKDVGNPAYVGVDPMYQNHANEVDAPALSDDNANEVRIVEHAKEVEAANVIDPKAASQHLGYISDVAHPSEAVKPADAHNAANRAVLDEMAAEAAERAAAREAATQEPPPDEGDNGSGSAPAPFGS